MSKWELRSLTLFTCTKIRSVRLEKKEIPYGLYLYNVIHIWDKMRWRRIIFTRDWCVYLSPEISPYKYINKIEMLKIQCLGNHMKKQNFWNLYTSFLKNPNYWFDVSFIHAQIIIFWHTPFSHDLKLTKIHILAFFANWPFKILFFLATSWTIFVPASHTHVMVFLRENFHEKWKSASNRKVPLGGSERFYCLSSDDSLHSNTERRKVRALLLRNCWWPPRKL